MGAIEAGDNFHGEPVVEKTDRRHSVAAICFTEAFGFISTYDQEAAVESFLISLGQDSYGLETWKWLRDATTEQIREIFVQRANTLLTGKQMSDASVESVIEPFVLALKEALPSVYEVPPMSEE